MIFHESANDIFTNIFNSPFTEDTVIWIVISGIIGGIITQVLKYIFENSLPEWKKKKATRIAIQKYDGTINMSALTLANTIKSLLDNRSLIENDLERLSILYNFGCFFGWIKVLLNESYMEDIMQIQQGSYRTKSKYQFYLTKFLTSFSYDYLFRKDVIPETIRSLSIPRYIIDSIGELMIDKLDTKNTEYKKLISYLEFKKNYQDSEDFRSYFRYLENWICESQNSRSDSQNNILILTYIEVICFYYRKIIKVNDIQTEWIPNKFKNIIYRILWLPNKIITSLYVTRLLIQIYRFDVNNFKQFLKSYFKASKLNKKQKERENLTLLYLIENEIDHLKYNTMFFFPRSFNVSSSIRNSNNMSLMYYIFPYFNYRFLIRDVFHKLYNTLEFLGYTNIINFIYKKELDYIKEIKLKNISDKINAEAWNTEGLVLTYLIEESKRSEHLISKAIYCFNKSWELNNNIDSLVNKGLLNLEIYHSQKRRYYDHEEIDYNKAKECFEKALEIDPKKQTYNQYTLIDIWNNLGITYYFLKDYNKAKECFEKALDLDPSNKLAEHNKIIILNKINVKLNKNN